MLIGVHSVIRITNDITGRHFRVAFTKEEDEKYVSNGKLSEKFMEKIFNEYDIAKYKGRKDELK
jgi:type II secretory pathway component GspD/PulD (secretin)